MAKRRRRPSRVVPTYGPPPQEARECARCAGRLREAERIIRSGGTIDELKQAQIIVSMRPKLGEMIKIRARSGGKVTICPHCTPPTALRRDRKGRPVLNV